MKNRMKPYLSALLCAALLLGLLWPCGTLTALGVEPMDYERDGLIAWYDGTNNGNGIHYPQTDYWKDLTGNGHHIDLRHMVSQNAINWTDNAMMVNPETEFSLWIPDNVKMSLENKAYTIELVLGEITCAAAESVTLLSSYPGELFFGFERAEDGSLTLAYRRGTNHAQYPAVSNAEGYLGGYTLVITSEASFADEGSVTLYADGVELASARVGSSVDLDYLYVGLADSVQHWGGEVHGLRIYDRVLTPEELAANTEADRFNYRQGNSIDPVERYSPIVCPEPVPPLPSYCNEKRLVFSNATDMIPMLGFYGSYNVLDYLYPYESDVMEGGAWEGARIYRSEEDMTDYDGNKIDYVHFRIRYNATCTRFGLFPVTGGEARYVVLKSVFEAEFETLTVGVSGFDMDTIADVVFEKTYSADDIATMMGGDQYLILDTEGLLDGAELIDHVWMRIDGMERNNPIYLKELVFCADEAEVEAYTGISLSETESVAETDPETTPNTSEDTVPKNVIPDNPSVTEPDTTGGEGTRSGCASAMGAGGVILLALGAAVVLTKKKD